MESTILIAGGTGLIGQRLSEILKQMGYNVLHLSRKANWNASFPAYFWNPSRGEIDETAIAKADYIIQLAGAGVADGRWTNARKQLIIDSRVQSNELIANTLRRYPNKVKAYIAASAIGFYGNRVAEELLDEDVNAGTGFLTESTVAWEKAIESVTQKYQNKQIRGVTIRVGIVLSAKGGALPKMMLPFWVRMGNWFGDGQQMMSWIHIDDICQMFVKAVQDAKMSGIYNGVAPAPVSNKVFIQTIGEVKGGWHFYLPVPAFLLRLGLGEMADVVLNGNNVASQKIENQGFKFQYRTIERALSHLLH
ncbi:MAG: hypothetical protein RLZZ628_1125 [Bacteroidota bacterium]|jgi:uncharacterized protein (TIGR01777 family)